MCTANSGSLNIDKSRYHYREIIKVLHPTTHQLEVPQYYIHLRWRFSFKTVLWRYFTLPAEDLTSIPSLFVDELKLFWVFSTMSLICILLNDFQGGRGWQQYNSSLVGFLCIEITLSHIKSNRVMTCLLR